MKKNIILFGVLSMLVMTSCNNSTNKKESVDVPPPTEKTTVVVDPGQKDGTTIKVNDQGISIENKEGSKKNNVKISRDSTSIEISKPK